MAASQRTEASRFLHCDAVGRRNVGASCYPDLLRIRLFPRLPLGHPVADARLGKEVGRVLRVLPDLRCSLTRWVRSVRTSPDLSGPPDPAHSQPRPSSAGTITTIMRGSSLVGWAYTYRIANFSLGGPNLRNWIEPPILARIGKGLQMKPLSCMPEGRYAFAAISPSFSRKGCLLPLPSLRQGRSV